MSNMIKGMKRGSVSCFYSVEKKIYFTEFKNPYDDEYKVCEMCSKAGNTMYKINITGAAAYHYMNYGVRCMRCLVKAEKKYIRALEFVKLPLFVNHVWVTPEGEQFYRECLSA